MPSDRGVLRHFRRRSAASDKSTAPRRSRAQRSKLPISRVLSRGLVALAALVIIPLGRRLLATSSSQPRGFGRAVLGRPYTRPCSGWGLPCRDRCRPRGGLLPHRFTLTRALERTGGLFSVALSWRSPSPGVTRHPALWSPDFPPGAMHRAITWATWTRTG